MRSCRSVVLILVHLLACSDDPPLIAPTLAIIAPKPGPVFPTVLDSVPVEFRIADFTLRDAGLCHASMSCGHVHLTIDGDSCNQAGRVFNDEGSSGPLSAKLALCPAVSGLHTITVSLHRDDESLVIGTGGMPVQASVEIDVIVLPPYTVGLYGSQVVPSLDVASTGSIALEFRADAVRYTLALNGVGAIAAVQARAGQIGAKGPLFVSLLGPMTVTGSITSSLASTEINLFDLLGTGLYIEVQTAEYPDGMLRGQVAGLMVSAPMTGQQNVPIVATNASGGLSLVINQREMSIAWNMATRDLSGAFSGAEIRAGVSGTNGDLLFSLASESGNLGSGDLHASSDIDTFAGAINALLSGTTYVVVKTLSHSSGEIRGQIGATQMNARLAGGQVVPTSGSIATGAAWIRLNGQQRMLTYDLTMDFPDATEAHVHFGATGNNGPLIFPLALSGGGTITNATGVDFVSVVVALLEGRCYVDVHSASNPDGEIRGQLLP